MSRPAPALLPLCLAMSLLAVGASGHTRSVSYSSWEIDGSAARVTFRIPQLELTRLPWGTVSPPVLSPALGAYLSRALRLAANGETCPVVAGPRALRSPPERAVLEWRVACATEGPLRIESDLMREVAPSHLHFARIRDDAGGTTERVLSDAEPHWSLATGAESGRGSVGTSVEAYLRLGILHIATGADHLVFLLGLLLLARGVGEVATIVTGFTLAHSLTLALAALGRLRPDAGAIEALIGLSIALVATENAWTLAGRPRGVAAAVSALLVALALLAAAGVGAIPGTTLLGLSLFAACYFGLLERVERPARLRVAIAFCFGLIHGFGFAGVLAEIELPTDRLVPALLGFNLGVEVGQLAIVAVVWPALRALARLGEGRAHSWFAEAATAVVGALGVFWLVGRAYG